MPSGQIIGQSTGTVAEVETTKALRGVLRPRDYTTFGEYRVGGVSGVMAAGIAVNKSIFAFRWPGPGYALVRRVRINAACNTVAFVSNSNNMGFGLIPVRSYISNPTGGTSLKPTGNMNKMRTSMATTSVAEVMISTTAALTDSAVEVLDQVPADGSTVGVYYGMVDGIPPLSQGKNFFAPDDGTSGKGSSNIFDHKPGEYPLVLAANEGFLIRTNNTGLAGTGTWVFSVDVVWGETGGYY